MRRFTLATVAFAALGATATIAATSHPNWTATVTVTDTGTHVLGNPAAPVKVAEFISYTCSHCADFQKQSEVAMRLAYVTPGKVSMEVRHLVRDPVDLAAALLANCGDPKRFFRNHNAFLRSQDTWMKAVANTSDQQKQRWSSGPMPTRLRAIANDAGLFGVMETLGYSRPDADRCLTDEAKMRTIVGQRDAAIAAGVQGTPSFMINNELLSDTHDWKSLETAIKARL